MPKLPEPASDFLRPDDVNDGDVVKIVAHPETIPAEQTRYGRERHVVDVALPDKTQKRWGLNLTSYRTLYNAYGNEGDDWIGKKVTVVKNREKVRGETRYVLYAEPHTEPQKQLDQPQPQKPATVSNDVMQIIDQQALAKLPRQQQDRILKKLSMQLSPGASDTT